jgi:KaiC/GvpD/RAD55 family RecA-like ATPase
MIKEKVKTGIPGIDNMLEGGLIPGRPYVVSGTSGTGKTAVAMRFLLEGASAGEQVLYVAMDEPPNEVKANMESFGWDISAIYVFDATPDILSYDKTPVRDVSTERKVCTFRAVAPSIRRTSEKGPGDITINTVQEILKQEMKVRKYTRIVIDSVTSLRRFYIRTSEEYLALQSFFRLLSDMGITAVLTVQLPEVSKPDAESLMARGEIRLHKWFDGKGLARGVTIEKFRGSSHDATMRPLRLTAEGVSVRLAAPKKRGEAKKTEPAEQAPVPDGSQEATPDDTKARAEPTQASPPPQETSFPEPPPPDDNGNQGGGQAI